MPLMPQTKQFLSFLRSNANVRKRIAAPPNETVLYAGNFMRPAWKDLEALKLSSPQFAQKKMLPDVLDNIGTPGTGYNTLLDWAKALDAVQPWKENGFIAWRALSGIYASNAVGVVSFYIASGITKTDKVFAATELPVLLRNPNVDALTKDILNYYERCIQRGESAINFGFIGS
jgi:hypothetical protein